MSTYLFYENKIIDIYFIFGTEQSRKQKIEIIHNIFSITLNVGILTIETKSAVDG